MKFNKNLKNKQIGNISKKCKDYNKTENYNKCLWPKFTTKAGYQIRMKIT